MDETERAQKLERLDGLIKYTGPRLNNRIQSIKYLIRQLRPHLEGDAAAQLDYIMRNVEGLETQTRQAFQSHD